MQNKIMSSLLICILFLMIGCAPSASDLIDAIEKKDISKVEILLNNGVECNDSDLEIQPLDLALRNELYEISILILEKEVSISGEFKISNKALINLQKEEQIKILELLIQRGLSANRIGIESLPLINWVIREKYYNLFEILLYSDLVLNELNPRGQSLLHNMILFESPFEYIKLVLDHGANINIKNVQGQTPLSYAINKGKTEYALYFIELDSDITLTSYNGSTPWQDLAFYWQADYVEVIDKYLEKGFIPTDDSFALHASIKHNNVYYTQWLLEQGLDLMYEDNRGWTPIAYQNNKSMDSSNDNDNLYSSEMDDLISEYLVKQGYYP